MSDEECVACADEASGDVLHEANVHTCEWFQPCKEHDWEGTMCLGCGATRLSAFERVQRVAREELAGGKNCFELALESCQSLEARLQLRQLGVMLGALDP